MSVSALLLNVAIPVEMDQWELQNAHADGNIDECWVSTYVPAQLRMPFCQTSVDHSIQGYESQGEVSVPLLDTVPTHLDAL